MRRSLALRALLAGLRPGCRHSVLDLGPPVADNIEFLAGLSCRVRIVDLQRSLAAETAEKTAEGAMAALLERLLPVEPDERYDAFLAWDVFDYLRPDQVSSLMARLSPLWQPEARALVLLSTGRKIPAKPVRHRILDLETIGEEGPRQPTRKGPQYSELQLARMMRGFSVSHRVLLKTGMQEYLLVRGAGLGARAAVTSGNAGAPAKRTWFRQR
ncbi:MAG TPA: hypothetical protein VI589_05560 [Vicinamibacteria bacterium]